MTVEINGKRYVERWEYYDLDTTKRKLEEENKELKDKVFFRDNRISWFEGEEERLNEEINKLKEENRRLSEKNKIYSNALVQEKEEKKKLKEKLSEITMVADDEKQSIEHILELEKEIKKLKLDLGTVINERDNAFKKIKQLEERLDNKEKVNSDR